MMAALNDFPDFQNNVPLLVERIQAMDDRYEVIFLPKFHCELNPVSMLLTYTTLLVTLLVMRAE